MYAIIDEQGRVILDVRDAVVGFLTHAQAVQALGILQAACPDHKRLRIVLIGF